MTYYHAPYSPSQLTLADTCLRRWAFTYRKGRRSPAGDGANAGTETHKLLEDWARGIPIDPTKTWRSTPYAKEYPIGELALEMAKLAPAFDMGAPMIEHEFVYSVGVYQFTGRIDLATDSVIHDWKTTSRPKYVKKVSQLKTDKQALVYANSRPDQDVDLSWVYGVWSDGSARQVSLKLLAHEAKAGFEECVLPTVERIHDVPADIDPLALPPTESACVLYPPAGCEFLSECTPTFGKVALPMNLFDKLGPAPAAPLPDAPMPAPVVAPMPAPVVAPADERPYWVETLFIDCIPLDQPYENAFRTIAISAETVCSDLHVHHVGLVDFAKGTAALAAQLVHDIKARTMKIERLVLETRTSEGRACAQSLIGISKFVVRGL